MLSCMHAGVCGGRAEEIVRVLGSAWYGGRVSCRLVLHSYCSYAARLSTPASYAGARRPALGGARGVEPCVCLF